VREQSSPRYGEIEEPSRRCGQQSKAAQAKRDWPGTYGQQTNLHPSRWWPLLSKAAERLVVSDAAQIPSFSDTDGAAQQVFGWRSNRGGHFGFAANQDETSRRDFKIARGFR